LSPYNKTTDGTLRMDVLNKVLPELQNIGKFETELELPNYPKLKHVIQNSHATINGTVKYKHFTVYATPSMNTNSLPAITENENCIEYFNIENNAGTMYTHKEIRNAVERLQKQKFTKSHSFLSTIPFSSPLASILADYVAINKKYITYPQSYNLKHIIYLISTQFTETLITEPELLSAEIPDVYLIYKQNLLNRNQHQKRK